jgi:hypothetical protein
MRKELEEKQPRLIVSGKETAELIAMVEVQTAEADKVKTMVEVSQRFLHRIFISTRIEGKASRQVPSK